MYIIASIRERTFFFTSSRLTMSLVSWQQNSEENTAVRNMISPNAHQWLGTDDIVTEGTFVHSETGKLVFTRAYSHTTRRQLGFYSRYIQLSFVFNFNLHYFPLPWSVPPTLPFPHIKSESWQCPHNTPFIEIYPHSNATTPEINAYRTSKLTIITRGKSSIYKNCHNVIKRLRFSDFSFSESISCFKWAVSFSSTEVYDVKSTWNAV